MSRYIDVDVLLLKIDLHGTNKFGMLDEDIREFIRSIPTADVAEVVRCKDCKYYQDNNGGYLQDMCRWRQDETPDEDDFCSFGERKDDKT